jgi:hypothetical protein
MFIRNLFTRTTKVGLRGVLKLIKTGNSRRKMILNLPWIDLRPFDKKGYWYGTSMTFTELRNDCGELYFKLISGILQGAYSNEKKPLAEPDLKYCRSTSTFFETA